jgi:RNA polymerase sigma-70 factor, ECF subfamily
MVCTPISLNCGAHARVTIVKRRSEIPRTRRNVWAKTRGSTACARESLLRTEQTTQAQQAFEGMFLASRPQFLRVANAILRNKEDAEDAVQNAFVSAFLQLHSFEGRSALSTWFTRVVMNAALMIGRKRQPAWMGPLPEPKSTDDLAWTETIPASQPDPEDLCAEAERLQQIQAALQEMKPILREAFELVYHQHMSLREACDKLGVATGTFKARVFRARQELFKTLCRSGAVHLHKTNPLRLLVGKSGCAPFASAPAQASCRELACNEGIR